MSLTEKLLDIQANLPEFKKNAKNPHFKNTYITLDALLEGLLPLLNERAILLIQEPSNIGPAPALTTTFIDVESGEERSSTQPLLLDKDTPQGHGSAITYGRRYALCSALNIVADEDDDGEEASRRNSTDTSGASGRSASSTDSSTTGRKF